MNGIKGWLNHDVDASARISVGVLCQGGISVVTRCVGELEHPLCSASKVG